jgi:plasmid stabilization system protein ParE
MNYVYRYIIENWWENSVDNFLHELTQKINGLTCLPNLSPKYHSNAKYRFVTVWGFIILFVVDNDTKTVKIHRIIHNSRNIESLIS